MIAIRKLHAILCIAGALAAAANAQPVVSAVLNGASYSAVLSPGCWAAIFGSNLASSVGSAQTVPLPSTLLGVSVNVDGIGAPLLYVSPGQINALIPAEVVITANHVSTLVVNSPGGSTKYNIRLDRNAPGIFTRNGAGTGLALLFDPSFKALDTVAPRDLVILYATGLGPTDASGRLLDVVTIYIGERPAQVLFAGLAPGFAGIYQLNVMAPVPATDRLYLRSGGWQSNITAVGIRPGTNTSNVSGTITGLYPSTDPAFSNVPKPCSGEDDPGPCGPMGDALSVMLFAGTFTVSFDILPTATAFDVAAVGEGGGTILTIDPASGTYSAAVTLPSSATRVGDLSHWITPLWDLASCDWITAVCFPFPGSIVPATRITPLWIRAMQTLPSPDAAATTAAASPNSIEPVTGKFSASRFSVDSQNNGALSAFGGLLQQPYGPFPSQLTAFKLYVDGKLVDSKNLSYLIWYRGRANSPDNSAAVVSLPNR